MTRAPEPSPTPARREAGPAAPATGPPSPWAIVALVCSVAFLCPFGCLLGPLLGARALIEIRANPGMGGRRMARTAIAIGLAGTIFWALAALWWNTVARRPMIEGPAEALALGQGGDVAAFQGWFFDPEGALDDDEAAAFLANLRARYGRFIMASQDEGRQTGGDRWRPVIPYVFHFEGGDVPGAARFVMFSDRVPGPVMKFAWVAVYEEHEEDLAYPSSRAHETMRRQETDGG